MQVNGGRGSLRWPIIDEEVEVAAAGRSAEAAALRWLSSMAVGSCNSMGDGGGEEKFTLMGEGLEARLTVRLQWRWRWPQFR
jgi:hypothetical protein